MLGFRKPESKLQWILHYDRNYDRNYDHNYVRNYDRNFGRNYDRKWPSRAFVTFRLLNFFQCPLSLHQNVLKSCAKLQR